MTVIANLKTAVLACVDVLATDSNSVCATLTLSDLGIPGAEDAVDAVTFEPREYYISCFLNGKFSSVPKFSHHEELFTHGLVEKFDGKRDEILGQFRR